jgi:hypothetical protein
MKSSEIIISSRRAGSTLQDAHCFIRRKKTKSKRKKKLFF